MIPGVQNPHCDAPAATKAVDNDSRKSFGKPSRVVIVRSTTRVTGVTHASRGSPSTNTVQHPHCPWGEQPSLAETTSNRSRKTESKVSPSLTDRSTALPSQVKVARTDFCSTLGQDSGMSEPELSRRTFILATGSVALVALSAKVAGALPTKNRDISPLVLSSDLYASPLPQRLVLAVAVGKKYDSSSPAKIELQAPESSETEVLDTKLYRSGLPQGRGVYVSEPVLATAGIWKARLMTRGEKVPFALQVQSTPLGPAVGTLASKSASPTPSETMGVNPICTREPPCALHKTSLDTVIGTGKPVAVLFATPALCQSQYCGPVLNELLKIYKKYPEITFVHVEIYKSNRGVELSPTVEAWGIESEPWFFTVDGTGTIVGRLDGAFGREEMVKQLNALQ